VINTGQHFDHNMSDSLFLSLDAKMPKYNLNINSCSHGKMVGLMMIEIEQIILVEQPQKILVYGDCDSTLAGALVASKLNVHLVHIEAGLRSFNKKMPEELNRIVVDHISTTLLCPNEYAKINLNNENIRDNIHLVENLQLCLLSQCINIGNDSILFNNNLIANKFVLLTLHRNYNTTEEMLNMLFDQINNIEHTILFPIHPKTRNIIKQYNIIIPKNILVIDPVNYIDMCTLLNNCSYVITDSGGLQVEAMYLNKKCFTVRSETEWLDTLDYNNCLVTDINMLSNIVKTFDIKKRYYALDIGTDWSNILKC
jgi:UDP-GlcNAc3NAcA epimerase